MRWLFSILICVAFVAGIVFAFQAMQGNKAAVAQLKMLQKELKDFDRLKAMYDEEEQKVAIVNALWDDLQKVDLKPEDWSRVPLAEGKVLNWREAEKLIVLASNRLQESPGYYFRPELLRVTRVRVVPEEAEDLEGSEVLEGLDTDGTGLPPVLKYDMELKGAFLIPKSE